MKINVGMATLKFEDHPYLGPCPSRQLGERHPFLGPPVSALVRTGETGRRSTASPGLVGAGHPGEAVSAEMLLCPFDVGEDRFSHDLETKRVEEGYACVVCDCGARGPERLSRPEAAVEAWNRRTPAAPPELRCDLLPETRRDRGRRR